MKQYENLLYTAYFVQITMFNKIVVLTAAKTRVSKHKSPKNASAKANNAVCVFGHHTIIKYAAISILGVCQVVQKSPINDYYEKKHFGITTK